MNFIFHFIHGMSSFPLTNSYFFKMGREKPPTRYQPDKVTGDKFRRSVSWLVYEQALLVVFFLMAHHQPRRDFPNVWWNQWEIYGESMVNNG